MIWEDNKKLQGADKIRATQPPLQHEDQEKEDLLHKHTKGNTMQVQSIQPYNKTYTYLETVVPKDEDGFVFVCPRFQISETSPPPQFKSVFKTATPHITVILT